MSFTLSLSLSLYPTIKAIIDIRNKLYENKSQRVEQNSKVIWILTLQRHVSACRLLPEVPWSLVVVEIRWPGRHTVTLLPELLK